MEYMLRHQWFETDPIRIGAEQEMCLVDNKNFRPVNLALDIKKDFADIDWLVYELAQFNLEINLSPQEFTGSALSKMEGELNQRLNLVRESLNKRDAELVLSGILPTLRKQDLDMDNMTPLPRYQKLIQAINDQLLGSAYELRLLGTDELLVKHDSPLMELVLEQTMWRLAGEEEWP